MSCQEKGNQTKQDYKLISELWASGEYTMQDIGQKLGISRERVRQIMIKMRFQGYPLLSSKEWHAKRKESAEFIRQCNTESHKWEFPTYKRYRSKIYQKKMNDLGLMKACMSCGYNSYPILEIHHIDHNRSNNKVENLLVVCPNCHVLIHKEDKTKTGKNYTQNRYSKNHKKKLYDRKS